MTRHEVYSVLPVLEPATLDDLCLRVYERHGYAHDHPTWTPTALKPRVRAHLAAMVREGVVESTGTGGRDGCGYRRAPATERTYAAEVNRDRRARSLKPRTRGRKMVAAVTAATERKAP